MRRSSLAAAGLALALGPLAGVLLGERIVGHARARPSSAPPPGDLDEAAGAASLARPAIPPPVELVLLPDRPEVATGERVERTPARVPVAAVERVNVGRVRAAALASSKAARSPTGKVDPDAPSPPADDVDFGF
jgi:hypothetical protein